MKTILAIKETYELKGIGYPKYYLRGDVLEIQDLHFTAKNTKLVLSARTYIKNTLLCLALLFDGGGFHKCQTPMLDDYHPELDESPLLSPEMASKY